MNWSYSEVELREVELREVELREVLGEKSTMHIRVALYLEYLILL